MTLKEVVGIAQYIQFPYMNEEYKDTYYSTVKKEIHKTPIISGKEVLYPKMKGNEHHYTTEYTYKYVLPVLDGILNFGYDTNDFRTVPLVLDSGDLSYIVPKKDIEYTVTCFTENESVSGGYLDMFEPVFFENPSYRPLYRYHHRCSRIVNHTTKSGRVLMISGDSQMVPSILPLSNYFKEVWYFDNRTGWIRNRKTNEYEFLENKFISFRDKYRKTHFTDTIIELYCRKLKWYEYWNLY